MKKTWGGNRTTFIWVDRQPTEKRWQLLCRVCVCVCVHARMHADLTPAPPPHGLPPAGEEPWLAAAAGGSFCKAHTSSEVIHTRPHAFSHWSGQVQPRPHFLSELGVLFSICTKIHRFGKLEKVYYIQHLFTSCDFHTNKNKHIFILSLIFGATYT